MAELGIGKVKAMRAMNMTAKNGKTKSIVFQIVTYVTKESAAMESVKNAIRRQILVLPIHAYPHGTKENY